MPLQLSVWYGILFRYEPTAENPRLPSWAVEMLGGGADNSSMMKELEERGYGGTDLTWIGYSADDSVAYYGLAVAASVQRTANRTGEVHAWRPEEVIDYWAASLAQAAHILGCNTTLTTWYQTCDFS